MNFIEKTFKEVLVDAIFYVWSDSVFISITYEWIECIKLDEQTAQELGGCIFNISPEHEVFILIHDA